jgi:hypothetical protein
MLRREFFQVTLMRQPLNSSVSNSAFEIKKFEIVKNSALTLNRYYHDKKHWHESQIVAARARAVGQALKAPGGSSARSAPFLTPCAISAFLTACPMTIARRRII